MRNTFSELWQVSEVFNQGPLLSNFDHPRAQALKNISQSMRRMRIGFMRGDEKIATVFVTGALNQQDADMLPIVIDLAQRHWFDKYGYSSLDGWTQVVVNLTDFTDREKHERALERSIFAPIHNGVRHSSVLDELNIAGRAIKAFEDKSLDDFEGDDDDARGAEKAKQREGILEKLTNQIYYSYIVHSMEYETIAPHVLKKQQEIPLFQRFFKTTP
jgi:hypothetical protein